MELRQIRYFIAVAECASFKRAAERIHIVQPALSRQVSALEESIGVRLLERLPRGVRLTAAGEAFLPRARLLVADLEAARRHAVDAHAGKVGRLRLGFNAIAVKNPLVPEALRRFRMSHGSVEFSLNTLTSPEQINRLYSQDLDVGFLYAPPEAHPNIDFVEIEPYRMRIAMERRNPLAKRKSLRLADLRNESFIWISRAHLPWIHDQLIAECLSKGFSPQIVQEADNADAQVSLVSVGLGLSFIHPTQCVPLRGVVYKEVSDLSLVWPLYMAWRRSEKSPVVTAFAELVRDLVGARAKPRGRRRAG